MINIWLFGDKFISKYYIFIIFYGNNIIFLQFLPVFSVVNNESFSSFANDLGIDVIINPRELTTSRIIEKISKGSLLSYHSIFRDKFLLYEVKYKNELFENIKKSEEIKHICTISRDNDQLSTDEHIPVNNDVLVLLVEAKNSHILEKYINDY